MEKMVNFGLVKFLEIGKGMMKLIRSFYLWGGLYLDFGGQK